MPTLADEAVEIANVKARYCAASDLCPTDIEAAIAGFRSAFTDDVVGDYGFRIFHGFDELTGFMTTAVAGQFRMDGAHAPHAAHRGRWRLGDRRLDGHGPDEAPRGRHDRHRARSLFGRAGQDAEGWRIAKVTFTRYS